MKVSQKILSKTNLLLYITKNVMFRHLLQDIG